MDFSENALSAALRNAATQWACSLPTIVVWMAGLFFAFARWRRGPKLSLLVMISCGLSLLTTLVMPILMYSIFAFLRSSSVASVSTISLALGFVWHCLAAVSTGLLIYAVFADRPQGEP
jgi:hypothetical protein